jgi:hypothetical protein
MKRLAFLILTLALLTVIGRANDLGVYGDRTWYMTGRPNDATDTLKGAATDSMIFLTPKTSTHWQFTSYLDTVNHVDDDSIRFLGRNLHDENDKLKTAGTPFSPILWVTGQQPYTTSEWLVFTDGKMFESAAPSDSSFVPGSGDGMQILVQTATTDSVLWRLICDTKE